MQMAFHAIPARWVRAETDDTKPVPPEAETGGSASVRTGISDDTEVVPPGGGTR